MIIGIRVDSSGEIGSGHVMRCLALAEACRAQGDRVIFICRSYENSLIDRIEGRGFELLILPDMDGAASADLRGHARWLGADEISDALQTRTLLDAAGIVALDWVVSDHYGIGSAWQTTMRRPGQRILAIDDLANRQHDCDLLLDQNLVEAYGLRYLKLVPAGTPCLLGPEHALLQDEYAALADRQRQQHANAANVLVYFGSSDRWGITLKALQALTNMSQRNVTVVLGTTVRSREEIVALCAAQDFRLLTNLPSLAPLMAEADLAIGAAGTTSWERLCLGLPAIIVTLAANQIPSARALHKAGYATWIGDADEVTVEKFETAIAHGLNDPAAFRMAQTHHIDGKGAYRLADLMEIMALNDFRFRHAESPDEDILLTWANDPASRRFALNSNAIDPLSHHTWFKAKLAAKDQNVILIAETRSGDRMGTARFELRGGRWVVSNVLSPYYRGRRLGAAFLEGAIKKLIEMKGPVRLRALVKPENQASMRVFESLLFRRVESTGESLVFEAESSEIRLSGEKRA